MSGAQAAATPGWRVVATYPPVQATSMRPLWLISGVTVSVGPSAGRGPVTAVLLHWNGKAWSKAAVPKGVSLGSLASDGHDGAWLTSDQSAGELGGSEGVTLKYGP